MITVFTPTYNRAHLLPVLYDSINNQSYRDFEWLIVDDGSTDGTRDLVDKWIDDATFSIQYVYQENGGKHRAINRGAQMAQGELFYIVDSDDKLPYNALETIMLYYNQIREDNNFAGVCGLKAYFDGRLVQPKVGYDILDCKGVDYNYRLNLFGGKAEVVKTDILKKYQFPEYNEEKYCGESAIWNRIGSKYYFRYFAKIIYSCEFYEDGLTKNSLKNRMNSPLSAMYIYKDLCELDVPYGVKIRAAVNYWRFYFCLKRKQIPNLPIQYLPFCVLGCILHLLDLRKCM